MPAVRPWLARLKSVVRDRRIVRGGGGSVLPNDLQLKRGFGRAMGLFDVLDDLFDDLSGIFGGDDDDGPPEQSVLPGHGLRVRRRGAGPSAARRPEWAAGGRRAGWHDLPAGQCGGGSNR